MSDGNSSSRTPSSENPSSGSSRSSTLTNTPSSAHLTSSSNYYNPQLLPKVTGLCKDIADTFCDRHQEMVDNPAINVDSKIKRKIEDKLKGQNRSM